MTSAFTYDNQTHESVRLLVVECYCPPVAITFSIQFTPGLACYEAFLTIGLPLARTRTVADSIWITASHYRTDRMREYRDNSADGVHLENTSDSKLRIYHILHFMFENLVRLIRRRTCRLSTLFGVRGMYVKRSAIANFYGLACTSSSIPYRDRCNVVRPSSATTKLRVARRSLTAYSRQRAFMGSPKSGRLKYRQRSALLSHCRDVVAFAEVNS